MNAHQKITICTVVAFFSLLSGCSTAPPRHRVVTDADTGAVELPSRLSSEQATDITIYAMGLIGTPYRYGGNTPDSGFDCSGLIGHVYQSRTGVLTPRTVARLQYWGQLVPQDNIRSGDLVLFGQRDIATHAGIYVGNGRFVHAPATGGKVRIDRLDSKYWSAQQLAFRRP